MTSKVVDGVLWTQTASPDFPNINVSLTSACRDQLCYGDWTYGEWTMYLERKEAPGSWVVIGKRTGYVSMTSPSHRTFTNVVNKSSIRVRTIIDPSAYHGVVSLYTTV